MVRTLKWEPFRGWKIRMRSAFRCLFNKHYVLVCWKREDDGDLTFKITHKGVELEEAVHRLQVDAVEILQDICDQDSAMDGVNEIINK